MTTYMKPSEVAELLHAILCPSPLKLFGVIWADPPSLANLAAPDVQHEHWRERHDGAGRSGGEGVSKTMNDLRICTIYGEDTPDADDCKWVVWAIGRGLQLTWNEQLIRDLMLAGY